MSTAWVFNDEQLQRHWNEYEATELQGATDAPAQHQAVLRFLHSDAARKLRTGHPTATEAPRRRVSDLEPPPPPETGT